MINEGTDNEGFYQLLGKIFYCAAMADRVIKEEEISKLNEVVLGEWEEHSQAILVSFHSCVNLGYEKENIWGEIGAHKTVDPILFIKEAIEKIVKTSYSITSSFSGMNKSEVVFISRLRNALEA